MVRIEDVDVREDLLQRAVERALSLPAEETAVVFPGRRAASHFALACARLRGGPLRPPALLTVEGLARKTAGLPPEGPEPMENLLFLWRAVLERGGEPLRRFAGDFYSFFGPGKAFLDVLETLEEEDVPDGDLKALRGHPLFDALGPLAQAFHEALPDLRAAYRDLCAREGAWTGAQALRRAAEYLEGGGRSPWRNLLFVGFFSLTRGQIRLLTALSASAEVTLLRHHDGRRWEAFAQMEAALEPSHPAPTLSPPSLDLAVEAAPSAHAEALRVAEILSEGEIPPEETVVVLTEPGSLLPLLWDGLGALEGEFNVTLGYPLSRSPVFALLEAVLRAAEEGEGETVPRPAYLRLLFHPYVKNFAPKGLSAGDLRIAFHALEEFLVKGGEGWVDLSRLEGEEEPIRRAVRMHPDGPDEAALAASLKVVHDLFLRRVRESLTLEALAATLMNLLGEVAQRSPASSHPFYRPSFQAAAGCLGVLAAVGRKEGGGAPDPRRLYAFVRERLAEVRVPFSGLPVRGLQVMGVLETQALRFSRVILLDADEETLPTAPPPDPFLPPAFRKALGLPGATERAEIYRYHVFRLLESSRRAHILHAESPGKGPSPFVEQLLWEKRCAGEEGRARSLALRGGGTRRAAPRVEKGPEVLERLRGMTLSPTALDAYLQCPLKFCWQSVFSLREREAQEETEARRVGSLLHGVLRDLFAPYQGRELNPEAFEEMESRLPATLEDAFGKGEAGFLLVALAEGRLRALLRKEKEQQRCPPGTILAVVEGEVGLELHLPGVGGVRIGGRVDRLDRMADGTWRLTDYKSGKDLRRKYLPAVHLPDLKADRPTLLKGLRSLQLPLYAEMVRRSQGIPAEALEARLLSFRAPEEEAKLEGGPDGLAAFLDELVLPVVRRLVAEIFDRSRPFEADPSNPRDCDRCPFTVLCRR